MRQFLTSVVLTVAPYLLWIRYVAFRIPYGNAFATLHMAPSWGIGRFSVPFLAMSQEMM